MPGERRSAATLSTGEGGTGAVSRSSVPLNNWCDSLRVFQRGHAPSSVDPLPSCCKQGSPEGMLEQESDAQVEGGKGRGRWRAAGSGPGMGPLDLICHSGSISVSFIWDCAQPRSAETRACSWVCVQHKPRGSSCTVLGESPSRCWQGRAHTRTGCSLFTAHTCVYEVFPRQDSHSCPAWQLSLSS